MKSLCNLVHTNCLFSRIGPGSQEADGGAGDPPHKKARSTSPPASLASIKSDTGSAKQNPSHKGKDVSKAKATVPTPEMKPEPSEPPTPSPRRSSRPRVERKQYSALPKKTQQDRKSLEVALGEEMDQVMQGDAEVGEDDDMGVGEEGLDEHFDMELDGEALLDEELQDLGMPGGPEDPQSGGWLEGLDGEEEEAVEDDEAE